MNDLILLASLLEGPKHGYALKKQAGLISGQTDMHNNLVYPALRRFVAHGWVTRKQTDGERGQTRQVYAITPLGRKQVSEKVRDFDESAAASMEEFRIRVGLFSILDPGAREDILEKRKNYLLRRAERFGGLEEQMDLGEYGSEVVRFIGAQIKNELSWIERLRNRSRRTK